MSVPPPPPHQHSCPNIPLLCLCNKVRTYSLEIIFTKPYQTTITSSKHLLPKLVPCALFKSTMNSYPVLPCQISNALLFHFSNLNQTFEPELYTNVGLTTTTSTFMSKNPLLSVSLKQVTETISESNLHQTIPNYISILPNPCYQNWYPALPLNAKFQMPLLSNCSILNQTFLQELHTNVGLTTTTTTSTFMSQNPLLPLRLCNKSQGIFWIQSPQNHTELHIHSSQLLLPKFPTALSISPCAAMPTSKCPALPLLNSQPNLLTRIAQKNCWYINIHVQKSLSSYVSVAKSQNASRR